MTLDEFLTLPEEKPYREFLRGKVTAKVAPDAVHGWAVILLNHDVLETVLQTGAPLQPMTEVRHKDSDQDWTYLPDVNVTRRDRLPDNWLERRRGPLEVTPDFVIEVLSPDDTPQDVLQRIENYMNAGLRLLWFLDPETESVTVCEPGKTPRVYRAPQALDAGPVFPAFRLDLAAFFDRLYGRTAS